MVLLIWVISIAAIQGVCCRSQCQLLQQDAKQREGTESGEIHRRQWRAVLRAMTTSYAHCEPSSSLDLSKLFGQMLPANEHQWIKDQSQNWFITSVNKVMSWSPPSSLCELQKPWTAGKAEPPQMPPLTVSDSRSWEPLTDTEKMSPSYTMLLLFIDFSSLVEINIDELENTTVVVAIIA